MCDKSINVALLIDGDNASYTYLQYIIKTISIFGKATIRRVYGDWSRTEMEGWHHELKVTATKAVQNFPNIIGKNSTDITLVIDAMDILHSKKVKGFCIVSSDSDFTGLAKRIREEGCFMMGIGNRQTPIAFQVACDEFYFFDLINTTTDNREAEVTDECTNELDEVVKDEIKNNNKVYISLVDRAYQKAVKEKGDEIVSLCRLGTNLKRIKDDFNTKHYGFAKLSDLIKEIKKYQLISKIENGLTAYSTRLMVANQS